MFLEEEVQFTKSVTRGRKRVSWLFQSPLMPFKYYIEKWESTQKALQTNPSQAQEAFARFCKNLDEIETKIEARNKVLVEGGKVPYTILLPSKIPAGIAVWGIYICRKINLLTFRTFASVHLMFWHLSPLDNHLIWKNVGHRFMTFTRKLQLGRIFFVLTRRFQNSRCEWDIEDF